MTKTSDTILIEIEALVGNNSEIFLKQKGHFFTFNNV